MLRLGSRFGRIMGGANEPSEKLFGGRRSPVYMYNIGQA
jgi:hypothetical protein